MLASTSFDPGLTAWIGAAVVLIGEFLALRSLRHLPRLILISTIAECGYLLLGAGLFLHLILIGGLIWVLPAGLLVTWMVRPRR